MVNSSSMGGRADISAQTESTLIQRYRNGETDREALELGDWLNPVRQNRELALRFPSAEGAHIVDYDSIEEDFVAFYVGPHGQENRPAQIDEPTISQLVQTASDIEVIESPNPIK